MATAPGRGGGPDMKSYQLLLPAVVSLGQLGSGMAAVQSLLVHGNKHDLQGVEVLAIVGVHEGGLCLAIAVPVLRIPPVHACTSGK